MKTTDDASLFQRSGHMWFIALFTLVMLIMLLAVLFGAFVYRMALQTDAQDTQLRSVEGYLSSAFRASDSFASVEVMDSEYGDVLCIYEGEDRYIVTYIYPYEGKLVQEYTVSGYGLTPEDAAPIAQVDTFDVDYHDGTVHVTTDEGTFVATLRSGGAS